MTSITRWNLFSTNLPFLLIDVIIPLTSLIAEDIATCKKHPQTSPSPDESSDEAADEGADIVDMSPFQSPLICNPNDLTQITYSFDPLAPIIQIHR